MRRTALMLGWLIGRGIEPHIPILDHEHQTNGYFTRADFTFDATANAFICPAGKQLTNNGLVREDGTMPYRANTKDCRECALEGLGGSADVSRNRRRAIPKGLHSEYPRW